MSATAQSIGLGSSLEGSLPAAPPQDDELDPEQEATNAGQVAPPQLAASPFLPEHESAFDEFAQSGQATAEY